MILRKSKYNLIYLLFAVLIGLMSFGCRDDISLDGGNRTENLKGLVIKVPNLKGAFEAAGTRADFDNSDVLAEEEEGQINSLWLCAFPVETGKGKLQVINLLEDKDVLNVSNDDKYKTYQIENFEEGKYKIFVFANLDDYLPKDAIKSLTSAEAVENLMLDFASMNSTFLSGNLPMACLDNEIKTSQNSTLTNGIFDFNQDSNMIYADLKFQCVKIRYTILFDNTEEGLSNSFKGSVIDFDTESATVSKIRNSTYVTYNPNGLKDDNELSTAFGSKYYITNSGEYTNIWKAPLKKVYYPGEKGDVNSFDPSKYPYDSNTGQVYGNLTEITSGTWDNEKTKRAWQGIVYVPENRQSISSQDNSGIDVSTDYENEKIKHTYINFKGTIDKGTSLQQAERDYPFALPPFLYKATEGESGVIYGEGIERSKLYDIIAIPRNYSSPELDIKFSVKDWEPISMVYDLMGPVELEVEDTKVGVYAGKYSDPLWFRSNVDPDEIKFDYPYITIENNGSPRSVSFYKAEIYKNENGGYILNEAGDYQIVVRLNPAIPFDVLQKIDSDQGYTYNGETWKRSDLNYFHIIARNLRKAIEVDPLSLEGFLSVVPEEIIIDVREYITSGINKDIINIQIDTNISNSLTLTSSSNDIFNITDNNPLGLTAKEGTSLTGSGTSRTLTITEGSGILELNIEKLFDGLAYWRENHSYTLTFTVEANGIREVKTVRINVKPYNSEYVIHFHISDNSKTWNSPHIYVYQCLELPKDLQPTDVNYEHRGKTVGYQMGANMTLAALEYSFTAGLAFKGWKGYGGPEENDPNAEGFYENWTKGFWIFDDGGGTDNQGKTYEPVKTNTAKYNVGMNFNKTHIDNLNINPFGWYKCGDCNNGGWADRNFPGILMEKEIGENEGWYKYVLTGVANPGKTLIIFSESHRDDQTTNGYRYPGVDKVGIPLFDFPDREGWFVFDGNTTNTNQNFVDDKPSINIGGGANKTYIDLYVRGTMNDWNGLTQTYQFYELIPNREWRTGNFSISDGHEFKLGDSTWGSGNISINGGGETMYWVQNNKTVTGMTHAQDRNMYKTGNFYGYVHLYKNGDTYEMTFISQ